MDDDTDAQKQFFYSVCNPGEIERIFNVQNGLDHLLKLRAETIVDHMRLFRVYRNKAIAAGSSWSLEASFDESHYEAFAGNLSEGDASRCRTVAFGDMFSNDPNGQVFATDYGPVITISDSLRFFLKFSHLALLDFRRSVPPRVRMNALRIAIRVMLRTEALDFYMDPRGIVPEDIAVAIHRPLGKQLEFIAGHEFAHYLLGHLNDASIGMKPIFFAISGDGEDYNPQKAFNQTQQEELAADLQAVLLPECVPEKRSELLEAALLWFGCLDLYEAVEDAWFPRSSYTLRRHPTARERMDHLLTRVPSLPGIDPGDWHAFTERLDELKKVLLEDVSLNIDEYEKYGSAYLDKPNTRWRGRELVDKVDYY